MALCTAVIDADTGKPRAIRWGWWHVDCMTVAARAHIPEVRDLPLLDVWSHEELWNGLTIEYPVGFKDPVDGEVFILNEGDRLNVWRDR
jgi:hypothetical protein